MKKDIEFIFTVLTFLSFFLPLGCKKGDVVSPSTYVITGRYQYYGYGTDSTLSAYGVIEVVLSDTIITGTRNIQAVDTTTSQFRETGIGSISGWMYRDSSFYLYLMSSSIPTILIRGKFSSGLINGPRILETGAGPKPRIIGFYTLQKQ